MWQRPFYQLTAELVQFEVEKMKLEQQVEWAVLTFVESAELELLYFVF
jgi:hypothetical protein